MKKVINVQYISIVLIITILLGCKKDDPSPQDEQLIALKNNGKGWKTHFWHARSAHARS